jgi:hypothetical protein
MLGKDFVAGFIAVVGFLMHPVCRIVTTSVKDDHLRVLWGEIGRFIQSARVPLDSTKGGPLILNHRDIRKVHLPGVVLPDGRIVTEREVCSISYLRGMVSEKGEGMAGHHAPWTLIIIDEASGVDDLVYTQADTWARRKLIIGNPNPCPPTHFFYKGCEGGDLYADQENANLAKGRAAG